MVDSGFRLVQCYRGGGLEDGIAELVNSNMSGSVLSRFYPLLEPETVREWFEGGYEPEEFAAIVGSGRVYGYAWAWINVDEGPAPLGFVYVSWDRRLPPAETASVVESLLAWARHSLESWQEVRGVVNVNFSGTEVFEVISRIIGSSLGEARPRYLLMEAPRQLASKGVKGVEFHVVRPDRDEEVLRALVGIYNDAFSIYESFYKWSVERARRFYKRLFEKREAMVMFAVSGGRPVGFVEASLHESISGDRVGEVGLLAVRREWQGMGVGSSLLSAAVEWLYSRGARRVYLDATPEASRLYLKLGFRIVYEHLLVRIPVGVLPDPRLDGVTVWDPAGCTALQR